MRHMLAIRYVSIGFMLSEAAKLAQLASELELSIRHAIATYRHVRGGQVMPIPSMTLQQGKTRR
jgi:hypothetical protein